MHCTKDEIVEHLIPLLLSVFFSRTSDVTSAFYSLNNGLGTFVGSQAGNTSPSLATGGDSRYRNLRIRVPESNRIRWHWQRI